MNLQRNRKRLSQVASHLLPLIEFGASPPLDEMNSTLLTAIVSQRTLSETRRGLSVFTRDALG
jgi:hypothetical protein